MVFPSIAVGARKGRGLSLGLPSIRALGYLVSHALVRPTSVELHELSPDDLKAPSIALGARPGGALSTSEPARGLYILDQGELQKCGDIGQESS